MRRFCLICLLLSGCMLNAPTPTEPAPTQPAAPTSTPQPVQWSSIAPGLEQRHYTPNGNALAELIAFRIDPARYDFRVHYRPAQPLSVGEWRDALPDAVLMVNANFFDENYRIVGLLIQDGEVFGWPYTDRGGLFAVTDGRPTIRANTIRPYISGEPIDHAVQAFPMLVMDGQPAPITADSGRVSRRTVVGMDAQGRVLLIVTPLLGLSLTDLAAYLPTTDMGLVDAFALDGGRSTMLSAPAANLSVPSIDVVPAVLAIYPR